MPEHIRGNNSARSSATAEEHEPALTPWGTSPRPWSEADVLTPTETAERLGGNRRDAFALADHLAVAMPTSRSGRKVCVWGDVLRALREGLPEQPETKANAMPRVKLGSRTPRRGDK